MHDTVTLKGDETVALLEFHRIGDTLMALPVLQAVKTRYKTCKTVAILDPIAKGIAQNNPYIDTIIYIDKSKGFWHQLKTLLAIRKLRIDVTLDTLGMPKTALLSWLSGARVRVGIQKKRKLFYTHLVDISTLKGVYSSTQRLHVTQAIQAFPDTLVYPHIWLKNANFHTLLERYSFVIKPYISSAPASKITYEAFDERSWAKLYDALCDTTSMPFYIFGAPQEYDYLMRMHQHISHKSQCHIATLSSADDIALFISQAHAHFCRDNGTKHTANALAIPCYTIFPGINTVSEWVSTYEHIIDDYYNLQEKNNSNEEKIATVALQFSNFLDKIPSITHKEEP